MIRASSGIIIPVNLKIPPVEAHIGFHMDRQHNQREKKE